MAQLNIESQGHNKKGNQGNSEENPELQGPEKQLSFYNPYLIPFID